MAHFMIVDAFRNEWFYLAPFIVLGVPESVSQIMLRNVVVLFEKIVL